MNLTMEYSTSRGSQTHPFALVIHKRHTTQGAWHVVAFRVGEDIYS